MDLRARQPRDIYSTQLWLLLMLAGAILIVLRTPEYWVHPSFYAEDGVIFFRDQILTGWRSLFHAYNGYLHLVPRLTAAVAGPLPIASQPMAYGIANVCLQSAAASFFFLPENRFLVRSDGLRLVTCALAMTAFQGHEMLGNVMVVQWYLFPVALLILLQIGFGDCPLSRARLIWYSVLMAVICLTVPLLGVLFPIALWVAVRARGLARTPAVVMAVLTCLQTAVFRLSGTAEKVAIPDAQLPVLAIHRSIVAVAGSWTYRVLFTCIAGEAGAKWVAQHGGELLALALCFATGVIAYRVSGKFQTKQKAFFRGIVILGFFLIGFSLVLRNLLPYFMDLNRFTFFEGGARYFFVPEWLLFVGAAMLIDRTVEFQRGRRHSWSGIGVMIIVFGLGVVGNYHVNVDLDQRWFQSARQIEGWRYRHEHHLPQARVLIPIPPEPFAVSLP
jgi:hypothetical protein